MNLNFNVTPDYPLTRDIREIGNLLHDSRVSNVSVVNHARNNIGVPISKAVLFDTKHVGVRLIEYYPLPSFRGKLFGRWWSNGFSLPKIYLGRKKERVGLAEIKEDFELFEQLVHSLSQTDGFEVQTFVYPARTSRESPALMTEVSIHSRLVCMTLGEAPDLMRQATLTRVWGIT